MVFSARTNTVAVIGLGNLGDPIARALIRAGWTVRVSDRNPSRVESLLEKSGANAIRGKDVAADVALVVVPDDEAVRAVVSGPDGLLAREAVAGIIVHSTVLPATAEQLARECAAHGVRFLDAPVSGGAARALAADLTVMVGAQPSALAELRPVLSAVASRVLHVGPAGAGAATKLANQIMMFSALAGAYEATDLAAAYGVKPSVALDAAATSTGASWVAQNWGFFPDTVRAYSDAGTPVEARPWFKDLGEAVAAAQERDISLRWTAVLAESIGERIEREVER